VSTNSSAAAKSAGQKKEVSTNSPAEATPATWECQQYNDDQDDSWCKTVGIQDGVEYKFVGFGEDLCGKCWCCKRPSEVAPLHSGAELDHHHLRHNSAHHRETFTVLRDAHGEPSSSSRPLHWWNSDRIVAISLVFACVLLASVIGLARLTGRADYTQVQLMVIDPNRMQAHPVPRGALD